MTSVAHSSALILVPKATQIYDLQRKADQGTDPQSSALAQFGYAGRILDKVTAAAATVLDKQVADFACSRGWGPAAATERMLNLLGRHKREIWLDKLRRSIDVPDEDVRILGKGCERLIEYALPKETVETQMVTFKKIIILTTRYPGLRRLFLHFTGLEKAEDAYSAIMSLWDKNRVQEHPKYQEWNFFRQFAATCVSPGEAASIVEETATCMMGTITKHDGVVDKLLRLMDHYGVYATSGLIAIRYLGTVLDLPTFWLQKNYNRHQFFAQKLFEKIGKALQDIGIRCADKSVPKTKKNAEKTKDLITEKITDPEAIDDLALTVLTGVCTWSAQTVTNVKARVSSHDTGSVNSLDLNSLESSTWFKAFQHLIDLLVTPHASRLLPHSFKKAKEFAAHKGDHTLFWIENESSFNADVFFDIPPEKVTIGPRIRRNDSTSHQPLSHASISQLATGSQHQRQQSASRGPEQEPRARDRTRTNIPPPRPIFPPEETWEPPLSRAEGLRRSETHRPPGARDKKMKTRRQSIVRAPPQPPPLPHHRPRFEDSFVPSLDADGKFTLPPPHEMGGSAMESAINISHSHRPSRNPTINPRSGVRLPKSFVELTEDGLLRPEDIRVGPPVFEMTDNSMREYGDGRSPWDETSRYPPPPPSMRSQASGPQPQPSAESPHSTDHPWSRRPVPSKIVMPSLYSAHSPTLRSRGGIGDTGVGGESHKRTFSESAMSPWIDDNSPSPTLSAIRLSLAGSIPGGDGRPPVPPKPLPPSSRRKPLVLDDSLSGVI